MHLQDMKGLVQLSILSSEAGRLLRFNGQLLFSVHFLPWGGLSGRGNVLCYCKLITTETLGYSDSLVKSNDPCFTVTQDFCPELHNTILEYVWREKLAFQVDEISVGHIGRDRDRFILRTGSFVGDGE